MSNELNTKVQEMTEKLLELMSIQGKVEIVEEEESLVVNIQAGEANGLLIGRRGETLSSLQFIVSVMLRDVLGEARVFVNVGDWKEKQEDYLKGLANEAAVKVRESGQEYPLYNLNASQRRVVHMQLSEESDLVTESVGEGDGRYLVVKPKA